VLSITTDQSQLAYSVGGVGLLGIDFLARINLKLNVTLLLPNGALLFTHKFYAWEPLHYSTDTSSYPKTTQAPPPPASTPRGLKRKPKTI